MQCRGTKLAEESSIAGRQGRDHVVVFSAQEGQFLAFEEQAASEGRGRAILVEALEAESARRRTSCCEQGGA